MSLSAEQIQKAKDDARRVLEYSTYVLCLTLGVDPDELDSSYVIPVTEEDPSFPAHSSLLRQISALEALG
jgi:hypothetical protein